MKNYQIIKAKIKYFKHGISGNFAGIERAVRESDTIGPSCGSD